MKKYCIMIVDDDVNIGNMLQEALEKNNYSVIRAYSGTEALMVLEKTKPDLILLDLMLPGLTGEELMPHLKKTLTIVMSANSDIESKVRLLYNGASDYITKPFVISELLARVAAQLRLANSDNEESSSYVSDNKINVGGVTLDPDLMSVSANGKNAVLTRTEEAILHILMNNPNRPLGRSTILDRISLSTPDCTERSLKQHIFNLRKKLQALDGVDHIETIYGIGFKYKS